jgi:ubiquinone/menaquinone biosynthesis C-methylase UbiE
MTSETNRDDSWNKYWEHGFLTSCRNAFTGNYEGSIRAEWISFFGQLQPGARVLDICTGNGAIAMIANEVSREHGLDLEIHGIDAAAIRPRETVTDGRDLLEGIVFHPETPAEDCGFEAGSVDAVAGQYALEYTDEARCIGELARVCAVGARLKFIVHHDQSIVMETTREEIRNGAILFDKTRLFERAETLMRRMGAAASPAARRALRNDPAAEADRRGLNEAAAAAEAAAQASPHPQLLQMALANIAEAYRLIGEAGLEAALAHLEESRNRIVANLERLEDLMGAARDSEQIADIVSHFNQLDFIAEPARTIRHDRGPLMGWVLNARRP